MPEISEHPDWHVILINVQTGLWHGEVKPSNLSCTFPLNEPASIQFDINRGHSLANKASLEPYATDFLLYHKGEVIMGGIVVAIGASINSEWLTVQGLDYLHYLEKRIWTFNPGTPKPYLQVATDSGFIAYDLINRSKAIPGSLDLQADVGFRTGFDTNFRIEHGDVEPLLEKIKDLGEQDPGFDFVMEVSVDPISLYITKKVGMYAPQKGVERDDYSFELGRNLQELSATNIGISATRVYGLGAGTSRKLSDWTENILNRDKYRFLEASIDLGDVIDRTSLRRSTAAELRRLEKFTRNDFQGIVHPEGQTDFWDEVSLGDSVRVIANTWYEEIDEQARVIQFEISPTEQGDEEVLVTFESASV